MVGFFVCLVVWLVGWVGGWLFIWLVNLLEVNANVLYMLFIYNSAAQVTLTCLKFADT